MGSRVSDFGFRVLGLSFTDLGLGCLVQGLGFVFGFGGLGLRVRFPMISSVGYPEPMTLVLIGICSFSCKRITDSHIAHVGSKGRQAEPQIPNLTP